MDKVDTRKGVSPALPQSFGPNRQSIVIKKAASFDTHGFFIFS